MALLRDIWEFASDDWRNWLCGSRKRAELAPSPLRPSARVRAVSTASTLYPESADCDFTLDAPDAMLPLPAAALDWSPDARRRRHHAERDLKGLQRASENLAACLGESYEYLENRQIFETRQALDKLRGPVLRARQELLPKGDFVERMVVASQTPRTQATLESYHQAMEAKLAKFGGADPEPREGSGRRGSHLSRAQPAALLAGPLVREELSRYYQHCAVAQHSLEVDGQNLEGMEIAALLAR